MQQSLSVLTVTQSILRVQDRSIQDGMRSYQWRLIVALCLAQNTNKISTFLVLYVRCNCIHTTYSAWSCKCLRTFGKNIINNLSWLGVQLIFSITFLSKKKETIKILKKKLFDKNIHLCCPNTWNLKQQILTCIHVPSVIPALIPELP